MLPILALIHFVITGFHNIKMFLENLPGWTQKARTYINENLEDYDAAMIIVGTITTIIVLYFTTIVMKGFARYGFQGYITYVLLQFLKSVPGGSSVIGKETNKFKKDLGGKVVEMSQGSKHSFFTLPDNPVSRDDIREEFLYQLSKEKEMSKNRAHGGLYVKCDAYKRFLNKES